MEWGMSMDVHYMSEKMGWGTPPSLFADLHKEFDFTLDPCASADNAK
jgi:hypothetical protein